MIRQLERELKTAGTTTLEDWHQFKWGEAKAAGFRGPAEAHLEATLEGGDTLARYDLAANEGVPRAVDHDLEMWGCVACNLCVTVCPNDAFFRLPTPAESNLSGRQQYMVLAELCNECGNCMVFCPENGDPAQVKAKLYVDRVRYEAGDGQGFLISAGDEALAIEARPGSGLELPRLSALLNDPEQGLPLRIEDLAAMADRSSG
jgi:putative selenate reductase